MKDNETYFEYVTNFNLNYFKCVKCDFWIISELVEKIQKHEPKIIQYCPHCGRRIIYEERSNQAES